VHLRLVPLENRFLTGPDAATRLRAKGFEPG
jgi:hypothetical protein